MTEPFSHKVFRKFTTLRKVFKTIPPPCAQNPKPLNFSPKPPALSPISFNLSPKPSVLSPKSSNSSPKSSVLSPKSFKVLSTKSFKVLSPKSFKFLTPKSFIITLLFLIISITTVTTAQAKSRYVTIRYTNMSVLKEFNENLSLGRSLSRMMKRKNIVTVEDEVYAKVDLIVEKVEVVLDMFPERIHFDLVLVPTKREVAQIYRKNYGKSANHIAYYSLSQKTIYMSVDDARLRVLAHEIGHMVVDHFFKVRPPYNIHELMAQFAEKHVTD